MGGKKNKDPDPSTQVSLFSQEVMRGPTGGVALYQLRKEALACQKCELAKERTTVVFGTGPAEQPLIAFVGEAPGEQEDASGEPFIGRSGQLLMRMLEAMKLARNEVFITNACLCRPPLNRTPTNAEIEACSPFLLGQLRAVRPKIIVCLGKTAAQAVLGEAKSMEFMRAQWFEWEGTPVRVTYHPAFLVRPEGEGFKMHAWIDLKSVLERLGLPIPGQDMDLSTPIQAPPRSVGSPFPGDF